MRRAQEYEAASRFCSLASLKTHRHSGVSETRGSSRESEISFTHVIITFPLMVFPNLHDVWRSERYLRREHAQATKEKRPNPDLPDAHLLTQRGPLAIEVELTDKHHVRLNEVIKKRVTAYDNLKDTVAKTANGRGKSHMLLTAQAMGLARLWRTGHATYDPHVKAWFGLSPDDYLVAFPFCVKNGVVGLGKIN
jgi:hypothetical protein